VAGSPRREAAPGREPGQSDPNEFIVLILDQPIIADGNRCSGNLQLETASSVSARASDANRWRHLTLAFSARAARRPA